MTRLSLWDMKHVSKVFSGQYRSKAIRLSATTLIFSLAISLAFFVLSRNNLQRSLKESQVVKRDAAEILRQEGEAKKLAALETAATRILSQAREAGLSQKDWNERRINIQSITMQRARVNELIPEVANNANQIFGAEQFDISVKSPAQGLFDAPSAVDDGVVLTLKGTVLFRSKKAPQ